MPLDVAEGTPSRKRRPNWTDPECLFLAHLMLKKKNVIKGKCSSGVSTQDKRQAWEEITQAINSTFPQSQRTISDCNKKWENLLAKTRQEIKRQKKQTSTESLSLEQFSNVSKLVISVMNFPNIVQQDTENYSELVKIQQNSHDENGNDNMINEESSNPLADIELPTYPDTPKPKMAFTNVPKSHTVQFSALPAAGCTAPAVRLPSPYSASSSSLHCTTSQERLDLEMSVLRRQEAVLKLQEEYYTLKIKLMKKETEEPEKTEAFE